MKANRQLIFDKYNGHCAYCGCELQKGWHVDELLPCRRIMAYDREKRKWFWSGKYEHPERLTIENQMPACASCNINKHSLPLESFRALISGFIKSLNRDSTQYKISKRYGLVQEIEKPVVFYFEQIEDEQYIPEGYYLVDDPDRGEMLVKKERG